MSAAEIGPALQAVGLQRSRRRRPWSKARPVIRDVSVTVAPGEIVGLLGPNGAGKTTTFQILAGLLRPHGGRVALGDRPLDGLPLWRRARAGLGYLPQRPTLIPDLTVMENVALGLSHLPRAERRAHALALLDAADLGALADAPGGTLSGGERRRAEIARALAPRPDILMVDEPFAGLDPKAAGEIARQLRHIADQGAGILLTDHHVGRALSTCDRAYILHNGALLMEGHPQAIAAHPQIREIWLGDDFSVGPSPTTRLQDPAPEVNHGH